MQISSFSPWNINNQLNPETIRKLFILIWLDVPASLNYPSCIFPI